EVARSYPETQVRAAAALPPPPPRPGRARRLSGTVPPGVELRHLRALVTVAAARTIGQAAARLGIRQPTLPPQLRQLHPTRGARPRRHRPGPGSRVPDDGTGPRRRYRRDARAGRSVGYRTPPLQPPPRGQAPARRAQAGGGSFPFYGPLVPSRVLRAAPRRVCAVGPATARRGDLRRPLDRLDPRRAGERMDGGLPLPPCAPTGGDRGRTDRGVPPSLWARAAVTPWRVQSAGVGGGKSVSGGGAAEAADDATKSLGFESRLSS